MKLNLCCGDDVRDDYINIDVRKTKPSVLVLDLEKEKLLESIGFGIINIRNDGGTNLVCWAYKKC
jgi:hypothetical protein